MDLENLQVTISFLTRVTIYTYKRGTIIRYFPRVVKQNQKILYAEAQNIFGSISYLHRLVSESSRSMKSR